MKRTAILLMLLPVVFARDRRIVKEPRIPPRCTTLTANLVSQGATIAASDDATVRSAALSELARGWMDDPDLQHLVDSSS